MVRSLVSLDQYLELLALFGDDKGRRLVDPVFDLVDLGLDSVDPDRRGPAIVRVGEPGVACVVGDRSLCAGGTSKWGSWHFGEDDAAAYAG